LIDILFYDFEVFCSDWLVVIIDMVNKKEHVIINDAAELEKIYQENVNNIETVHLHFGLQLIFDESQKECLSEIWIDVYDIVRLLNGHRSSLRKTGSGWQRVYPYRDLDIDQLDTKL
jgi:hypothetical protein